MQSFTKAKHNCLLDKKILRDATKQNNFVWGCLKPNYKYFRGCHDIPHSSRATFSGGVTQAKPHFLGVPGMKSGVFRGVPEGSGGFRGNNAYSVLQKAL